ncbi:hypothetical protein LPJ63_004832, partial [Coemansia sp. RSA 2711]
ASRSETAAVNQEAVVEAGPPHGAASALDKRYVLEAFLAAAAAALESFLAAEACPVEAAALGIFCAPEACPAVAVVYFPTPASR